MDEECFWFSSIDIYRNVAIKFYMHILVSIV